MVTSEDGIEIERVRELPEHAYNRIYIEINAACYNAEYRIVTCFDANHIRITLLVGTLRPQSYPFPRRSAWLRRQER